MKWSSVLSWFALGGSLLLGGCRESNPLPPGNWLGRCAPSADTKAPTDFGPAPTTFVRDPAQMLRTKFAAELERALSDFQLETCHQLSVVSVASLEGGTLESYSLQYANRVGLGYRRLNNGVMLLLSPKTDQARIQIGCGLEDAISDAQANEVLQRDVLPAFREGSHEEGVRAAVVSLMALARKKTIADSFRPEGCRRGAGSSKR